MITERFNDRMVTNDDLIIVNKGEVKHHNDQAVPHGVLYELLGHKNGHRVVREIACNTIVVGGAITALEDLTGATPNWRPSAMNSWHNVPATPAAGVKPLILLYGAGIGGSEDTFGVVNATSIKQRDVISPIPLRTGASIDTDDTSRYFMKEALQDGTFNWWLKKLAGDPIIKSCWKNAIDEDEDGQEITSDIYDDPRDIGIETFAEFTLDFSEHDMREYFEKIGQTDKARYNTFGLYTGIPTADGTEYAEVRLYSVINMNNRSLVEKSRAQYIYRLYALI